MRRLSLTAWVTGAVILAATVFVFVELQPSLLFRNTTPSGGDMGAHVWGPAYLRDHLLPHGRLTGWAPDWYAGFPYLVFYFPLPSLLIVALDVILPYGIAFKLVTVLGLLTLPLAAWAMGKLAGMKDPVPLCMGIFMVPFLFDRGFTIYGGNIPSTLAGEFAFSISLSIALVFLGVFARGLQTGRYRALSAGLLAVCALCHVVPAFYAIAGAFILTVLRWHRLGWLYAWWTFAVSGLLAAFWVVPFLARLAYTNDMGWEKIKTYRETLVYSDVIVLLAILGAMATLLLAILSAVWNRDLSRRFGPFLTLLAAVSALAFVFMPQGRLWNARLLPFWILTTYLLAGAFVGEVGRLAARGIALVVTQERGRRIIPDETGAVDASEWAPVDDREQWPPPPPPPEEMGRTFEIANLVTPVAALAISLYLVALPLPTMPSWALGKPPPAEQSFIPAWVRWNYTGYEGKAAYPEYRHLISTMEAVGEGHGCGRAMWEYEPELDRLGTPMALMLLPYWTDGCIGSMEGLFFESSATTPYHFINQAELSYKPSSAQRDLRYSTLYGTDEQRAEVVAQGVRHLQLLGVRYFMALSDEVKRAAQGNPDLELVATSGPWNVQYNRTSELVGVQPRTWEVYKVADSELVAALDYKPAVMQGPAADGGKPWLHAAEDWYHDEGRWHVPLAAGGPKDWPRVRGGDPDPPEVAVDAPDVTNIRSSDDRISFDVSAPGTPVLVKASYFPNWQASGAKGPWRVTPNLMVVVPTDTHVELHYGHTPVDLASWGLTLLGGVGLVFLARRRRLALAAE